MPGDTPGLLPTLSRTSSKTLKLVGTQWLAASLHLPRRHWRALLLVLAAGVVGVLLFAGELGGAWRQSRLQAPPLPAGPLLAATGRDHLLLYAFSNSDSEALPNLLYFIREAVEHDTLADFIIIVQEGPTLQKAELPPLPPHAAYVRHLNECYDWGSYGWLLLRTALVSIAQYRYFFFINSSVRGPFLPAYTRGSFHWMSAFTSRLSDDVKLVGSTISCEGSPLHGKRHGRWRRNPHVQSYAFATDAVGLQVLIAARHVLSCQRDRWDTIYYAELGSSAAILGAGFNLDCLMLRYQGVDWRDKANWECNAGMTPTFEFSNDGLSVDPLEVMFVKVKGAMLANGITYSTKAAKLDAWQQQSHAWALAAGNATTAAGSSFAGVAANAYVDELHRFKAPLVLAARARGAGCFDFNFYAKENADLRRLWGDLRGLWRHWVYYGQFDLRPHKWTCDVDYKNISSWPA